MKKIDSKRMTDKEWLEWQKKVIREEHVRENEE